MFRLCAKALVFSLMSSVSFDALAQSATMSISETEHSTLRRAANDMPIDRTKNVSVDQALASAEIRLTQDALALNPLLNVGAEPGLAGQAGETPVVFSTYWNYPNYISSAEIHILTADTSPGELSQIGIVPVDLQTGKAIWNKPEFVGENFVYKLRVNGQSGRYDETHLKHFATIGGAGKWTTSDTKTDQVFGTDATRLRNIQISGGTVTVAGRSANLRKIDQIRVNGIQVQADEDSDFAVQLLMPYGSHVIEVSYCVNGSNCETLRRTIEIKRNDLFLVGLGDLTVGSGGGRAIDLESAEPGTYDETFTNGRVAFYLKGQVKGQYLITAALDTTEVEAGDLLSGLDERDPRQLFRKLDPNKYYPVYGDDSTLTQDAPTYGKFYLRLERGDDSLLWGNFFTGENQAELARVDRGLFGAKAAFNSDAVTARGERQAKAVIYAADPGTLPSREEFRGTGGSLYYLQNRDLVLGSERVYVETRDRITGAVLERRALSAFQDYEIDSVRGRILLSRPLRSTASDDRVVRRGSISGESVYLVVSYEHETLGNEVDDFTKGARGEAWVGDSVRLGTTLQDTPLANGRNQLYAGDMLIRGANDQQFVRAELGKTRGPSFAERSSFTGGLTSDALATPALNGIDADAWRLEAQTAIGKNENTTLRVQAEEIDSGYSGPGQVTLQDTTRRSAALSHAFDSGSASLEYSSLDIEGGIEESRFDAEIRRNFHRNWSGAVGVSHSELEGSPLLDSGSRTDAALEARYAFNQGLEIFSFVQATLDRDDLRSDANRAGVGFESQMTNRVSLSGEVSDGDGGIASLFGLSYQRNNGAEYYLNYSLDADRRDAGFESQATYAQSENALAIGARRSFGQSVMVYGEQRHSFGNVSGLTNAFGIDFNVLEGVSVGASIESGELLENGLAIERDAFGASAGYATPELNFGGAFEWLEDRSNGAVRNSWLFRSNLGFKVSPDWRAHLAFNRSKSDDVGAGGAIDFSEINAAAAWRPVASNRWNGLLRYTYVADVPPAEQTGVFLQRFLPSQKSHVFSADGEYRLTDWISVGGKLGHRAGEISLTRRADDYVSSRATLAALRADLSVNREWDALIEWRTLDVQNAESKSGFLTGVYRHIGDHAKVGIGYNFSDVSDDLTNLSRDQDGLFFNLIAKY